MGIESGIVARLNAVSAVTSLVSNRIYADYLPDGSIYPAIVYQVISMTVAPALSADTTMREARIQLTLIDDSKTGIIVLSDAVQTALNRFKGTASDVSIRDSRLENLFDQAWDLNTQQTARIADYLITYQ